MKRRVRLRTRRLHVDVPGGATRKVKAKVKATPWRGLRRRSCASTLGR